MPFYDLDEVSAEFVTPRHSTAFGRLITGERIELGVLTYKAGEGAEMHSHPHEQIILVLKGRLRMTVDGEVAEIGANQAVHIRPDVPHRAEVLEDAEVVSCKSVVGGVGHRI